MRERQREWRRSIEWRRELQKAGRPLIGYDDVCAVLVTRGDVDLTPIIESLPYGEVVVWDNSKEQDQAAFGRYVAISKTARSVIYFQDDDCIVPPQAHSYLLARYKPGVVVANMPKNHLDYAGHGAALIGWGSIFDRGLPEHAFAMWSRHSRIPSTQDFNTIGCDLVFPYLSRCERVDRGRRNLPYALDESRTWRQPGYLERKAEYVAELIRLRAEFGIDAPHPQ